MSGKGYVYFITFVTMPFVLSGCPDGGCLKAFSLQGMVEDGAGNPLSAVQVVYVTHSGFTSQIAVTDADGKYSVTTGRYSEVGNSYLIFKKSGFQDFSTESQPISDGNGLCEDQIIVRDAAMVP